MKKINLAVIFGGQSSEYSVSLHSAASFLRQIHAEKYQMTMIGIDQEGIFYIYDGRLTISNMTIGKNKADPVLGSIKAYLI